MSKTAHLTPRDVALALTVTAFWGLNVVAVKLSTSEIPPFLVTALRFLAVAAVLCPFHRLPPNSLRHVLPIGVVMGVGHFGLLFFGLSGVDAATGSVIVQLGAPFSVLLAWIVFADRPDARCAIGILLALSGVALLAGLPGHPQPWAVMAVVVSEVMWAVAMLLVKRAGHIPPLALNGGMALMATPFLLVTSAIFESGQIEAMTHASLNAWLGVAYTVVGASLIGYTIWYGLLARHPVSSVVPYTLLGPVFAFAGGNLVLGEAITAWKIVGGILTAVGVAIVEWRKPPVDPPEPPT